MQATKAQVKVWFEVDFCGGAANTHGAKLTALCQLKDVKIPPDRFQCKADVIGEWFPHKDGGKDRTFDKKDYDAAMYKIFQTTRFFELVKPMPGAVEAFQKLSKHCEIHLVSATRGLEQRWVWQWLEMHGMPVARVSMTRQQPKTDHYAGCVAAVDDQLQHLLPLVEKAATKPILLLPPAEVRGGVTVKPPYGLPEAVHCARGWPDVLKATERLLEAA